MSYGTINCSCGQEFDFVTKRDFIECIQCGKEYDVSSFPKKEENDEETQK